jgi:DNA processing protein
MSDAPAAPRLTDRQRLHWLRLIRTENVGPATFRELINRFGSAEAAIEALPDLARAGGSRRTIRIASAADAETELAAADAMGARFIAIGEPDYPPLLRHVEQGPPILAVIGDADVLRRPTISIVGARNASLAGVRMARTLAADLGRAGYAIASGLARGIDAAAHQASLNTGTIAVLAGGLDRPYPPENIPLYDEISRLGAAVTEMPFGWEPRARDFPRRNRIVAGLGAALIVVEAAERSGSLISARLANEIGRTVFAVPGSPLDPRATGTNGLLKQGATIVTEAADVLDMLAPLAGAVARGVGSAEESSPLDELTPEPDDGDRARVTQALGPTPVPIDDVIRHTGLAPAQVYLVLLELDLAGRLERHAGGLVSLLVGDP